MNRCCKVSKFSSQKANLKLYPWFSQSTDPNQGSFELSSRSSWQLDPNPRFQYTVYSRKIQFQDIPESLNVRTCHNTEWSSCGLISSGLFPSAEVPALSLPIFSMSLEISLLIPPGTERNRSRRRDAGSWLGSFSEPRVLERAASIWRLRSVTDAFLRMKYSDKNSWTRLDRD